MLAMKYGYRPLSLNAFRNSTLTAIWIAIPLAFALIWTLVELTVTGDFAVVATSENGLIENSQVVIALTGCLLAMIKARDYLTNGNRLEALWFGCMALGMIYIAGEEVSWGQWIFHWDTPAPFQALNDQNETNLHNMSSWLDQKPRIVLELMIIFSGLVFVFINARHPGKLPVSLVRFLPPAQAAGTAIVYVFFKVNDILDQDPDMRLFVRASELVEITIYYYLLAYVLTVSPKPTDAPSSGTA